MFPPAALHQTRPNPFLAALQGIECAVTSLTALTFGALPVGKTSAHAHVCSVQGDRGPRYCICSLFLLHGIRVPSPAMVGQIMQYTRVVLMYRLCRPSLMTQSRPMSPKLALHAHHISVIFLFIDTHERRELSLYTHVCAHAEGLELSAVCTFRPEDSSETSL